ncbi:hypothetical protein N7449_009254 [Penicillium cf. viridicatum]|uniref:Uncharacterized protein n=1 Tax=Penicillium cf. viridicatum TaxID=2972119 RepID=A0A9W9JBB1_9EURO|nr:hypothetical protein N7449_009254 [Penicillium cf. viridicatum]
MDSKSCMPHGNSTIMLPPRDDPPALIATRENRKNHRVRRQDSRERRRMSVSNYAKTRRALPAIRSFAGGKRGDSGNLLACLINAQAVAAPLCLTKYKLALRHWR